MNALGSHLLVSLFFVVATMIEFAVVMGIKRVEELKANKTGPNENKKEGIISKRNAMIKHELYLHQDLAMKQTTFSQDNVCSIRDKIDFAACCLFLFSYFLFNCSYMANYM